MAYPQEIVSDEEQSLAGADPPVSGLVMEEDQDYWFKIAVVVIVVPYVLFVLVLIGSTGQSSNQSLFFLSYYVIPCVSGYILIIFILPNLLRFRLRSKGRYLECVPRSRRFTLLKHVAAHKELVNILGPQRPRVAAPFAPALSRGGMRFVSRLGGGCFFMASVMPPLQGIERQSYFIQLAAVGAVWGCAFLLSRKLEFNPIVSKQIRQGRQAVSLEPAQSAILSWDWTLGQEYLLVEINSERFRIYNTTHDPLYLLFLARQQIPRFELRIESGATLR